MIMDKTYIHPSSQIGEHVKFGRDVYVGPFCSIQGDVFVGDYCRLHNHVSIGCEQAEIQIGAHNTFFPGSAIGGPPQDLKYVNNEKVSLVVGDKNTFRECVTVSLGTPMGGGQTSIGHSGLFMAYVHVGHDCTIGNHVVVANTTNFAGHVVVEDHVKVSGSCSITPFVRLGEYSYTVVVSTVNKDILPYTIARASESSLYAFSSATNKIGLERGGVSEEDISIIHKAIRTLLKGSGVQGELIEKVMIEYGENPYIKKLIEFIKNSQRGLARG